MIIGHNPVIMNIKKIVREVSQHDSTVLIIGETGSGKEFIAREIHRRSRRKNRPFVVLSCKDLDITLRQEDILGKIEEDANDILRKTGIFEQAGKGTLFLADVHEAPPFFQKEFISMFSQNKYLRIGSSSFTKIEFRIIAGTSCKRLSKNEDFRQDLYEFLSNVTISVPPLRKRRQDIPLLVNHFIKVFTDVNKRKFPPMPSHIFESLMEYSWPGNVSELKNTIRNLVLMSPDGELSTEYLPFEIKKHPLEYIKNYKLKDAVAEVEKFLIRKNLSRFSGNQSKAAKAIGISEAAFRYKMKKFGITKNNY